MNIQDKLRIEKALHTLRLEKDKLDSSKATYTALKVLLRDSLAHSIRLVLAHTQIVILMLILVSTILVTKFFLNQVDEVKAVQPDRVTAVEKMINSTSEYENSVLRLLDKGDKQ